MSALLLDEAPAQLPRRLHVYDGKVYLIRDLFVGRRFLGCEYATLDRDAQLVWRSCPEGVDFSAIEPLGEVRTTATEETA